MKKQLIGIVLGVLAGLGGKAEGATIENIVLDVTPKVAQAGEMACPKLSFDVVKDYAGEKINWYDIGISIYENKEKISSTEKVFADLVSTKELASVNEKHYTFDLSELNFTPQLGMSEIYVSLENQRPQDNLFTKFDSVYSPNVEVVRYDNDHNIPEPSTLAILSLGAGALLRRRKD